MGNNVSSDYEDEDVQKKVIKKKVQKPEQQRVGQNVQYQQQRVVQNPNQQQRPIQNLNQQYQNQRIIQNAQQYNNIQHQQQYQQNIQNPQYIQQNIQNPHHQYYNAQPYMNNYQQQQMNVQQIQQQRVQQQQYALPQFPNRIQKPNEELVKQFQQNGVNNMNHQMMPYPTNTSLLYNDRTFDTMIERPLPHIEFNKANFNDRIEEYEKNCNKEEEEFEAYEKERKSKFKNYMDKKRDKLKQEIKKFEENYNPYEILGLEQNDLDISNIRKAYKKMALKYHPDKAGEEYTEQFQVITQSYIYLLKKAEDVEKRNGNFMDNLEHQKYSNNNYSKTDPSYDLANKIAERSRDVEPKPKRTYNRKKSNENSQRIERVHDTRLTDYLPSKNVSKAKEINYLDEDAKGDIMDVNEKNFDINKFNSLFEKYKMPNEEDKGYGDILKHGLGNEEDEVGEIFNKGMSKEIFNAHFDNMKSKKSGRKQEPLIPESFDSSSSVSCAQIGSSSNFSGAKYTDIKQAFYEDNMLIDPNSVKSRKDYRNLQELENERSRLSYDADPETKRIYDQYEREKAAEEEDRMNYLRNRDEALRSHHNVVSRKFLVNGRKVE
jgi:hypothetical protein